MRDPYEVLEVPRGSSEAEIRAAYRRLCLRYHPDKHASADKVLRDLAEERFKEIQAAYEAVTERGGGPTPVEQPTPDDGASHEPPHRTTATSPDDVEHAWSPQHVCTRCGASRASAIHFGWPCKPQNEARGPGNQWASQPETFSSDAEASAAHAAEALVKAGRWHELLAAASAAEARFGRRRWALEARVAGLEGCGDLAGAVEAAAAAFNAFPNEAVFAFTSGRLLVTAERYQDAIAPLTIARALAGEVPDVLALLAISYEMTGNVSRADVLYLQVDRVDPENRFVAMRDDAAGVTRGRYAGGTSNKGVGCGGLLLTVVLFVLWLITKSLK